ncbi:PREDICTED: uncharacterized protein LOC105132964 [Populus euphratica]|uniref:Uncharacterized protein LOC105132964 n=1 Tax=Populus euphratica TaxID=75702 RepID=A0AAJ6XY14_POPEU|nr:PREDICTED: uncharacterized protein LOC105132964 [Populus euphratica]
MASRRLKRIERSKKKEGTLNQPPQMTTMKPVTDGAYGVGIPPASETQSADGPAEKPGFQPKHQSPPSTGYR